MSSETKRDSFLIVSGLSGSGKSLVHRFFEDIGYFCVDNLPIELIPKLAEMRSRGGSGLDRVALTVDARGGRSIPELPALLGELRAQVPALELLFIEASDAVLGRRFSETRRPHPLADASHDIAAAIAEERALLAELRGHADVILDTSQYSARQLREHLLGRYGDDEADGLRVGVVSFGFRNGLPVQADLVFDVRFLPNPYYDETLRPYSGNDAPVREFLEAKSEYHDFLEHAQRMLEFLLPSYQREGKSYLTIAIGCTGGRHRSVAIATALHAWLESTHQKVTLTHRDRDRPENQHAKTEKKEKSE
ncbi:MAG: RNase adapter RapZ [Acidobacteriota bacterium]